MTPHGHCPGFRALVMYRGERAFLGRYDTWEEARRVEDQLQEDQPDRQLAVGGEPPVGSDAARAAGRDVVIGPDEELTWEAGELSQLAREWFAGDASLAPEAVALELLTDFGGRRSPNAHRHVARGAQRLVVSHAHEWGRLPHGHEPDLPAAKWEAWE